MRSLILATTTAVSLLLLIFPLALSIPTDIKPQSGNIESPSDNIIPPLSNKPRSDSNSPPPSKKPPPKEPPSKKPPSKEPPSKKPPSKEPPSKKPPPKEPPSKKPPSKEPPSKKPPPKEPPSKKPPPKEPPPGKKPPGKKPSPGSKGNSTVPKPPGSRAENLLVPRWLNTSTSITERSTKEDAEDHAPSNPPQSMIMPVSERENGEQGKRDTAPVHRGLNLRKEKRWFVDEGEKDEDEGSIGARMSNGADDVDSDHLSDGSAGKGLFSSFSLSPWKSFWKKSFWKKGMSEAEEEEEEEKVSEIRV